MNADDLPKDAYRVSSHEAQKFLGRTISNWEPVSEVWHFRFAGNMAGAMAAISSGYVVYEVRRFLKLRTMVRMTCYLPVAGLASFLAETLHDTLVTPSVMSVDRCSVCTVTESALLQAGLSVAYPMILSPLIGFYYADRLMTYPVPSLRSAPKEWFQLWVKMLKMNNRPLMIVALIQGGIMALVTQQKLNFMHKFTTDYDV